MGNIIDDVKSGNLAKVEEILKRDPSLSNSKDGIFTDHWSALHWAAHFNHKDMISRFFFRMIFTKRVLGNIG